MATDTRKRIFVAIMSSEDYIDCTQNLMKLKLNKLIECCLNET